MRFEKIIKTRNNILLRALIIFWLSLAGCSSTTSQPSGSSQNPAAPSRAQSRAMEQFEEANSLLDNGQYAEAAEAYDKLRVKNPATAFDFSVLFNSGIAYQSLGDCAQAENRYRQLVRLSNNRADVLQAYARLRLADVLSCQGNDKMATVNLVELYNNRHNLPIEVAEAEVPARLAAAYRRIGQNNEADRYFNIAERGYRRILAQQGSQKRSPLLAKTLYTMGNLSHLKNETVPLKEYILTLQSAQKYLLQAAEMGVENWSFRSAEQLIEAYTYSSRAVQVSTTTSSDDIKIREDLQQRREWALQLQLSLRELRRLKAPGDSPLPFVQKMWAQLDQQERLLTNFLSSTRVGTAKTREAEEANALRQDVQPSPTKKRN